jgi:glycine/D-amino acid oxidase-like deaminating enzyme
VATATPIPGINLWSATADALDVATLAEPPGEADVAIIGGGYTGMAAALALARHGTSAVVLERETPGWGASTRNGGFVLSGYKPDADVLIRRYGREQAGRLWGFALEAVDFVERLVRDQAIDCDLVRSGHITLAARPAHSRSLAESARLLQEAFGYGTTALDRESLREEIGSTRYVGGLLDQRAVSLHPVRYFAGLAAAAVRAGARVVPHCEVLAIARKAAGFELTSARGVIRCREVLIATNGYGGRLHPALAARVIPVGSYIVATAPLDETVASRLVPRDRVFSDTKHLLYYFRIWNRRLVFGGRASFAPDQEAGSRDILARGIREVFPELGGIPIEYSWGGTLGFARDWMPHAGVMDGVHFALAYAGHGVALASYLGYRMGALLAKAGEPPVICELPFPAVPLYRGRPWFLPLAATYYRMRDWVG